MSYWTLEGLAPALFGAAPMRDRLDATRTAMAFAMRTIVTRRGLTELDERALADVGLTPAEALAEARRGPWHLQPPQHPRRRRHAPPPKQPVSITARLSEVWRRRRSRQAITSLDPRMLKDIGVSYAEAECEANKAFWRL